MSRNGFKWSVNEILSLQREFELLGWNVDEIADKHERTPNAIMYKLDQEGFADYNVLYSNYHNLNSPMKLEKNTELYFDNDDNDEDDNDNDEDDNDNDQDDDYVNNSEPEYEDDATLSERVYRIEESVNEIKNMLKKLVGKQSLYSLRF